MESKGQLLRRLSSARLFMEASSQYEKPEKTIVAPIKTHTPVSNGFKKDQTLNGDFSCLALCTIIVLASYHPSERRNERTGSMAVIPTVNTTEWRKEICATRKIYSSPVKEIERAIRSTLLAHPSTDRSNVSTSHSSRSAQVLLPSSSEFSAFTKPNESRHRNPARLAISSRSTTKIPGSSALISPLSFNEKKQSSSVPV
mmetsp:Transcript_41631/g.126230  ORF Transcript_41631/g.126230 Transcript_41631/m.126230 type:complete len:200 (+) Transcript_41631:1376-1975(+)